MTVTNRKSHTRFRVPKSMTLDNLERRNISLAEIKQFCGAQHKHFNEDRFILSAAKCRPKTLISRNIRNVRIFAGFLGEGPSNDSDVVDWTQANDVDFNVTYSVIHVTTHVTMLVNIVMSFLVLFSSRMSYFVFVLPNT